MEGEMHTPPQEKIRLERRKRITINLEIQKKPHGYPIYLRVTENGQHYRYKSSVELKRKSDWDSKNKKIKPSEPMSEEWQAKLDALYNKAELRIRDGWHFWEYWHNALRLSLPFASHNFDRP